MALSKNIETWPDYDRSDNVSKPNTRRVKEENTHGTI